MKPFVHALVVSLLLSGAPAVAAQGVDVGFASAWPELSTADKDQVMRLAEEFKQFIGTAKSEMLFVREAVKFAESRGFKQWPSNSAASDLKAGSRWYAINRDRTMALVVVGSEPIENGMRIVTSHIDSVRIEFKARPFRESNLAVLVDTQVHGGIKNYQWANVPLAIIGRMDKADGTTVSIDIGNKPDDPVLLITDLAPHEDKDFRERKYQEVIKTEELDPILATLPADTAAGQKTPHGPRPCVVEAAVQHHADRLSFRRSSDCPRGHAARRGTGSRACRRLWSR